MEQPQPKTYASIPPHALALFRILFGIILAASWLATLLRAPSLTLVEWLLLGGMLIFSILFTMGAWMRLVACLLSLVYAIQWILLAFIDMHIINGAGEGQVLLFSLLLFAAAVSGADRGFSYAMFRRYGSAWEWEDVRARGSILLKGIITIAYLCIGLFPFWQPIWLNGLRLRSALIGSLGTGIAARVARTLSVPALIWIVSPLQSFAILLPFCLWVRSIRPFFLLFAVFFHAVIGIFLGKWWLLALMVGLPLFLDPETVRRSFEKIHQSQDTKTTND